MPNISVMKSSNFLKKEEVGDGTVVTITGVSQENVAKQGAPEELKWCIHFAEFDKPMVCNAVNSQLIAKFCGSEETDDWSGKKIILYDDPTVSYAGKLTGGIRVRQVPKTQAAPSQPVSAPVTLKAQLKAKFRAHPDFNKDMKPDDISGYFLKEYNCKLDDLTEEQAGESLQKFDKIVEQISIPF